MDVRILSFAIIASAVLFARSAAAITADTLAQFLGVSSWETTVSLPPGSFTVEIYEIVDGKVGESFLRDGVEAARNPEKRFSIVIGPHDGRYKVSMSHGAITHSVLTKVPIIDDRSSGGIAAQVEEGDFILFGQTKDPFMGPNDVRSFALGFLLRVAKNVALPAEEEAKARQCLSNAKQTALACELYAMDNNGKFPTKRGEIFPDYIADPCIFICPLWTLEKMGYELLGGNESDAPAKPLVRARYMASDGKRSVVYIHGWRGRE